MAKNPFLWWLPDSDSKTAPAGSKSASAKAAAKTAPKAEAKPPKAAKPAGKSKPQAAKPAAKPAKPASTPEVKPAAAPVAGGDGVMEVADLPGNLIRRAQQIAVASFLAEIDTLTPVQFAALAAVAGHPGADATRIAGLVALDRTTISGVLERLEAKGLIGRATNAEDRRAKTLEVTASGKKLLRRLGPSVAAAQNRMMAPLSRQERGQLISLLGKLVALNNDTSRAPHRTIGD